MSDRDIIFRMTDGDGAGAIRNVGYMAVAGVEFFGSRMRLEMGSDVTSDPHRRPSRIIIETSAHIAEDLAARFAMTPFTALSPVREEQIRALQAQVAELAMIVARLEMRAEGLKP